MVFIKQSSGERQFQTSRYKLRKTIYRSHYLTIQLTYPHYQYLELQKRKVTSSSQYQRLVRKDLITSCQNQECYPFRLKHFQNVGNILLGKIVERKSYIFSHLESRKGKQVCRQLLVEPQSIDLISSNVK